jgi:hypothetical protein
MGGRESSPSSLDDKTLSAPVWTPEQRRIIEANANERLLVDAGPGTGKTATACARIAAMLARGDVDATEIWLLSFTRTAVHELRNRIASLLPDAATAAALRITTIDAHAWAIHVGFDEAATISGSFDDNVRRASELVRRHDGVFGYVNSVRHLLIDEAQDIVGPRCELVLELIHALPAEAGVSVFADEAQAIYGFAEEGGGSAAFDGNLPDKIREFLGDEFTEHSLEKVHRTKDAVLSRVFGNGRELMRDKAVDGRSRLQSVRKLVQEANHGTLAAYWEDVKTLSGDDAGTLLLFRRRGDALAASGNMNEVPHRLRMSGLPRCIHGWIAVLLWDWMAPDLDESDFARLWSERLGPPATTGAPRAWAILVKAFGRSERRISVERLVVRLASGSPTYELLHPDFGSAGPIFSTIHGSKGREAADVRLYLPKAREDEQEGLDEEARIVFVGATRAQKSLRIGSASSVSVARRLEPSGRSFTPYPFAKSVKGARAAVEVGSGRDIDPVGLVGRTLYPDAEEAMECQRRVMALGADCSLAYADATDEDHQWRYRLSQRDGAHLCYLNVTIGYDLFSVAKFVDQLVKLGRTRPPRQLRHLRLFGVRTIAVAPDDPLRAQLHAPWRDSGVIAAPMLMGYSMVYFR